MDGISLSTIINNYKIASLKAEESQREREKARDVLLRFVKNKEGKYEDISIALIKQEPSFDWKSFLHEHSFPQKIVSKYYKERNSFFRVIIQRNIIIEGICGQEKYPV